MAPRLGHRAWLTIWLLMATANVTAGIVFVATEPERASALVTVRQWAHDWLFDGSDIYAPVLSDVDYPPHAVVTLSPLAVIPGRLVVPAWAVFNLALALLAPYLAARLVAPRGSLEGVASLTLMFLCWSGARTLLQFSLLMLVLGLAAQRLADRRPGWSGVCLGLSLMKPQIAAPFLLWTLLTRRWNVAAIATFVVALGSLLFCLRVHANPIDVAAGYLHTLKIYYTGDSAMAGESHLRPLVAQFVRGSTADGIAAFASLALLGLICVTALTGRKKVAVMYSAPALAGVWSLLTFYHLTYGFVLLLPAAALLFLSDDPGTHRARMAVFWVLQLGLMFDLPGVWRRFGAHLQPARFAEAWFANFDRLLILFLFAALIALDRLTLSQSVHQTGSSPTSLPP